jgi:hypothetical protein
MVVTIAGGCSTSFPAAIIFRICRALIPTIKPTIINRQKIIITIRFTMEKNEKTSRKSGWLWTKKQGANNSLIKCKKYRPDS